MQNLTKFLLHVPHSSTRIPSWEGYLVSPTGLQPEIEKLTDWYTDILFDHPDGVMFRADFSRLFCDVERLYPNSREPMSSYGMGFCYELFDDGREMREVSQRLREEIYEGYYKPHHDRLTDFVQALLGEGVSPLIVDAHSFSSVPYQRDLDKRRPRPDFNLGTCPYHTPEGMVHAAVGFLEGRGYSVGVDWPYTGCLVPEAHYQREPRVRSVRVEVNRELYLNPETCAPSDRFASTRIDLVALLTLLHQQPLET